MNRDETIEDRGRPIAELREVERTYERGALRVRALAGVSLRIEAEEFVAITGPSGGGKSTLLNLLAGVDRADAGSVQVCGSDLRAAGEGELTRLRRHSIGVVFQDFQLMPNLCARENVALPLALDGRREDERVRALLERVGLGDRLEHYPAELSGGEQQRVAVARALVHGPALVVADEPTGNLDSQRGREVLELLLEMRAEQHCALVMATHDAELASLADRILKVRDGRLD